MKTNIPRLVALVLVIVGALNWGLVGAFQLDLVAYVFGIGSFLARTIYLLVSLAGVYLATQCCSYCSWEKLEKSS